MIQIKKFSALAVLVAATVANAGCGDETGREPQLDVQVIGWGPGEDGSVGFQPRLPTFPDAAQVRVNLTRPAAQELIDTRSFNPVESRAVLPELRFGDDLRLEFELLGDAGVPLATGATSLFSFRDGEVAESFRIQVDAVDEFAPVGSVVSRDGRSELVQSRLDYRAASSIDTDRWLGRVGHVTVPVDGGNEALVVGGGHVDPVRRPAGLPEIDVAHDDLMTFEPRTGYFTDLSYDSSAGGALADSADRLGDPRLYHTVTPVGDDKFVVIGGFTFDGEDRRALNSIELVDLNAAPGSRVQQIDDEDGFTATLFSPRAFHTATYRSADNSVIIAGGVGREGANDVISTVELLDLDTGVIREVGAMSDARAEHEAVLMGDGETIWILGGRSASGALASTEAVRGLGEDSEVTSMPSMNTARYGFSALRLTPNDGQLVMAIGGFTDLSGNVTDTYEVASSAGGPFKPEQGSWRLEEGRGHPEAVELPHTKDIAVLGGRADNSSAVTTAEILEFGNLGDARPYRARSVAGETINQRMDFTATQLSSGKVLLVGGVGRFDGTTTTLDSAEYFTPLDPREVVGTE